MMKKDIDIQNTTETQMGYDTVLPAVFCRRIGTGKYFVRICEHEYEIYNRGYYPPDKCVWWEAVSLKTNEADFHEHSKSQLLATMKRELS